MTPVTGVTFKCAVPLFCWIIMLTVNVSIGLVWYSMYLSVDLLYLFIYLLLGKVSKSTSLQPGSNSSSKKKKTPKQTNKICNSFRLNYHYCFMYSFAICLAVNTQIDINWAVGCCLFYFLQRGGISIWTWKKSELFMTCFSLRDGACNYKITYVATMKGPTAAGGCSPSLFSFSSFPAFIWI